MSDNKTKPPMQKKCETIINEWIAENYRSECFDPSNFNFDPVDSLMAYSAEGLKVYNEVKFQKTRLRYDTLSSTPDSMVINYDRIRLDSLENVLKGFKEELTHYTVFMEFMCEKGGNKSLLFKLDPDFRIVEVGSLNKNSNTWTEIKL